MLFSSIFSHCEHVYFRFCCAVCMQDFLLLVLPPLMLIAYWTAQISIVYLQNLSRYPFFCNANSIPTDCNLNENRLQDNRFWGELVWKLGSTRFLWGSERANFPFYSGPRTGQGQVSVWQAAAI